MLRRLPVRVGEFAPNVPFKELLGACVDHITYTPLHNAMGTPAMSVPLSWSTGGLPIGSQFAARIGDERLFWSWLMSWKRRVRGRTSGRRWPRT